MLNTLLHVVLYSYVVRFFVSQNMCLLSINGWFTGEAKQLMVSYLSINLDKTQTIYNFLWHLIFWFIEASAGVGVYCCLSVSKSKLHWFYLAIKLFLSRNVTPVNRKLGNKVPWLRHFKMFCTNGKNQWSKNLTKSVHITGTLVCTIQTELWSGFDVMLQGCVHASIWICCPRFPLDCGKGAGELWNPDLRSVYQRLQAVTQFNPDPVFSRQWIQLCQQASSICSSNSMLEKF